MRFSPRLVVVAGCVCWLNAFTGSLVLGQQGKRPEFARLNELEARFRQAAVDLDRGKLRATWLAGKKRPGRGV